jgi:hypothetical protein
MSPDTACGAEKCPNSPSSQLVPARLHAGWPLNPDH